MNGRIATVAAVLAVLVFLSWIAARSSPGTSGAAGVTLGSASERTVAGSDTASLTEERGGSAVPCAVPLSWRIARVDPQFGVSGSQARDAVEKAASLWNQATGEQLFVEDSTTGFPVRLVYGDRQIRTQERMRLEDGFQRVSDSLGAWRDSLSREVEKVKAEVQEIEDRRDDLERRASRHNLDVESWNQKGGAPAAVRSKLDADTKSLVADRAALSRRAQEVDAHQRSLMEEQKRYNDRILEHRHEADSLTAAYPAEQVESGVYREAVRSRNGTPIAVSREIQIYRFDDLAELERVAAHELGHALGLGHTSASGAIMSATYGRDDPEVGDPVVRPADMALLEARCPGL